MSKYTGRGARFLIGTSLVSPTYIEVAQVASIGSVSITSDETETTTLDNISGYKEFAQTFKDAGELPLGLLWDPDLATHGFGSNGLWGLFKTGYLRPFQIWFPTRPLPYIGQFQGFVKTFPTPSLTPADAMRSDLSIRVSGGLDLIKKLAGAASTATPDESADSQQAKVSTPFTFPLLVHVLDANGLPVSGVTVTYTVPGSGASATLSNPTAVTNSFGEAQVTATANATAGNYDVEAAAAGVAQEAVFSLQNLPA